MCRRPHGRATGDASHQPARRVEYAPQMRQEFEELVRLGPLPTDDDIDDQTARQFLEAIDALREPPTAEEALALITVFPPDDSDALGLAWGVLHAIEASPSWPVWSALDDHNWWVSYLRARCERAGLKPPE